MKFVGRIFSIIGGVVGILSALGVIFGGVMLLLINVPEIKDLFMRGLEFAQNQTSIPFTDYIDLFIAGSVVAAIFMFIFAAITFVAAGLSLTCHNKKSYVATIVLNVIAEFNTFAILGAIFGSIFDKKE